MNFISVGQGDSILLSRGNLSILVDGGRKGSEAEIIGEINSTGDSSLELVVATHPDADHIGGLPGVMRALDNVALVWDSGVPEETEIYREYLSEALRKGNISHPKKGDSFNFGGIRVSVLNPGEIPHREKNENSLVLLVSYGGASLLLAGDCEGACEEGLAVPDVDVLKVAHHGSKYATGAGFLAAARPEVSVISVGRNSYGHPSNETIGRLEASGSRVLRTDLEGTIRLTTNGRDGFLRVS